MTSYLTSYVKGGQYHPLLFIGENGMGKKLLATETYRYMNCEGSKKDTCHCSFCRSEKEDLHLFELDKNSWGINDVRDISSLSSKPPLKTKYRAIVIEHAEKITPEGSDVFLKMVEENKSYNFFAFLTPYADAVIPTLKSRCWKIYVPPISEMDQSSGIPQYKMEKSHAPREEALLFIESFFEKDTLMNAYDLQNSDFESLIFWSGMVLHSYFTESSLYLQKRLDPLRDNHGVKPLLMIYHSMVSLLQKMKRYPNINPWHHFFNLVFDTKLQIVKMKAG